MPVFAKSKKTKLKCAKIIQVQTIRFEGKKGTISDLTDEQNEKNEQTHTHSLAYTKRQRDVLIYGIE